MLWNYIVVVGSGVDEGTFVGVGVVETFTVGVAVLMGVLVFTGV